MRAVIDAGKLGIGSSELREHAVVNRFEFSDGEKTLGDASLVTDNNNGEARAVEQRDGLGDSGQELKVLPARNVLAFRGFPVDYAVTIEKRRSAHERVPFPPTRKQCGRSGYGIPECEACRSMVRKGSDRRRQLA